MSDFIAELPGRRDDYTAALRAFVERLYAEAGAGKRYFLDKTPRYHLICNDILELFPDAKVVFLWRNPMAIVASIVETWRRGAWKLHAHHIDLFDGLARLTECYATHASRACSLRYEDLLADPKRELARIFAYLDLDPDDVRPLEDVRLRGRLGDRVGTQRYSGVSSAPLEKWQTTVHNPLRRDWCRKYAAWIGRERLAIMGYDASEIARDLDRLDVSFRDVGNDVVSLFRGRAATWLEPTILKHKLRQVGKRPRLPIHS